MISLKGKPQVGAVASGERGQTITALCCCNAEGRYLPPTLIFPRKKENPRLLKDAPMGTLQLCSKNGWINGDLFLWWLKFFVSRVKPSKEESVLLVVDNHASHRTIDVLEYANEHSIIMLSVPPHTTHRLQPLDKSVYGPLGTTGKKL